MTDSKPIETHKPCEDCGSSDALSSYSDGHTYCFSCTKYRNENNNRPRVIGINKHRDTSQIVTSTPPMDWTERRISKAVSDFYNVQIQGSTVVFPYYQEQARAGAKTRFADKRFITEGLFTDCGLFGHQTLNAAAKERSRTLVITEGEADALAAFQMVNRIPENALSVNDGSHRSLVPVFSIKSGAASAERDFKNNLELLEDFDRVFICFDNDFPGQTAAEKCARLLSPGKAFIVHLEHKDACEYSSRGMADEFMAHMKAARAYTPSGIVNASDAFDNLWSEQNLVSIPFPFAGLQEKTLGLRSREIVTWAAGTGVGKSSILRELQHFYLKQTDITIGIIALEESVDRTRRGILAVEANDRLHLNEVFARYDRAQIKQFFDATLGTGRVYLYDHFGSMNMDDLLSRVRYMVVGLDCRVIFIDHLSILVSGLEIADERKAIDRTMTLLRQLTEETGCAIHLVTHLRRLGSDRSHEEGEEINLGHLRGSHGIAQISDTVVALERNTQSDDPVESNTTTLRVLKCRYTGEVGLAGRLYYNKLTGRMEPAKEEF